MSKEDPLVRMHREYREECIKTGTYRPFTDEEFERAVQRWKALCEKRADPTKRRRKNPKGTAD